MDYERHNRNMEDKQTDEAEMKGHLIKTDHCDLLLDAMDAHLEQLQINHHPDSSGGRSSGVSEPSKWTKSSSKDTGFESMSQIINSPMSCLDQTSADPVMQQNSKWKSGIKVERQCHREQVMWRLGRLLGDACREERTAAEEPPLPSDSICTEDFVRCFREEMVESLPDTSERDTATDTETEWNDYQGSNKNNSKVSVSPKLSHCRTRDASKACQSNSSADPGQPYRTSQTAGGSSHEMTNDKNLNKFKFLSGIPFGSFDLMSIDSDLESVCTEQDRNYIHRKSEKNIRRFPNGNLPNTSTPLCKDQHRRNVSSRLVCSVEDPDEDVDTSSRRTQPVDALDRVRLKDCLSTLRQRRDKEQETQKRRHVVQADLTLSELQLRRKDLEWLAAETALMEREKRDLESSVRDRKAERDALSGELQRLQRERETRQQELGRLEEEVSTRRREREDEERRTREVVSVPEKAEQRRAREKLESMQKMLRETCGELQRLTQVVGSASGRCSCVQETLRQEQTEGQECRACELQGELGRCKTRVETLEKMLKQRDLQMSELQEQHKLLLAERNDLKGALQNLEKQLAESAATMDRQMRELVFNHEQQIKKLTDESIRQKEEADEEKQPEKSAHFTMREVDLLRKMLQEKKSSHDEAAEEKKKKNLRSLTLELDSECRHLRLLLLEPSDRQQSAMLPKSATVEEALTHLRAVRSQLQHLVKHLNQEVDSQKHTVEQLRKEKEEELVSQRQQLLMERKQALEALKKRLIQEHIQELSHLRGSHMCQGEERGMLGSLRGQLKVKDAELQEVQRRMDQWKEQTAATLACKFEEELTSELERCRMKLLRCRSSKPGEERQRLEKLMSEKTSACQHSLCETESHSDLTSLKLLRHLQTRVKQLRVHKQTSAGPL